MFQLVRPVGEKIVLPGKPSQERCDPFKVKGYRLVFVNCGTAALGLALSILKAKKPDKNKVLVPAYCCPDILAAVLFNNLEPVLVDLAVDSTYLDLEKVEGALSEECLAVIGINFLGIPERTDSLKVIAAKFDVVVIEDSAQFFPFDAGLSEFKGDLVILSFGKGKPLSILGGGALLIAEHTKYLESDINLPNIIFKLDSKFKLKVLLYNLVLKPFIYRILTLVPFLNIGATRYHSLESINRYDGLESLLSANFLKKQAIEYNPIDLLRRNIAALKSEGIVDLSARYNVPVKSLLRYPILMKNCNARDRLLECLNDAGVSATAMYKACLFDVPGVVDAYKGLLSKDCDVAQNFADRLITIPTHSGMSAEWVGKVSQIIKACA